jgi:NADPH2:quinone reductase
MRAVVCKALGDEAGLSVEDFPAPVLRADGVRIRVRAAGVNFADSLVIAGRYQFKQSPPFVPGWEVAGDVIEVAEGVDTCRPGDRVMALVDIGGFAELAVARAEDVHVLPPSMDYPTAAGFLIAYGTSCHALVRRAALTPGETLVVHGAAGGVGSTAVEIGRLLGATVIATAGGGEKVAAALARGADHGIDYKSEDTRRRILALTDGRGADVVFDPVGGAQFDASLRSTAPHGRIVVVGFASGAIPQIPANILLVKTLTVIGYDCRAEARLDPGGVRDCFHRLLDWYAAGRLRPLVTEILPLAAAASAIARLKDRRAMGKLVLEVD